MGLWKIRRLRLRDFRLSELIIALVCTRIPNSTFLIPN